MNLQQYRQVGAHRLAWHKDVQNEAVFGHWLSLELCLDRRGTIEGEGLRITLPAPWRNLGGIDSLPGEVVVELDVSRPLPPQLAYGRLTGTLSAEGVPERWKCIYA